MATCHQCDRCQSAVCDGRTVVCLGCGTEQCHGNGHMKGSCSVCHYGILPGWSSWRQTCGYKGCSKPAAFHYVPGAIRNVCHDHANRPKITMYRSDPASGRTMTPWKFSLVEYVARGLRAARLARGVVQPGEQSTPRALFLSVDDERAVDEMIARARQIAPFVPAEASAP